MNNYKRLLLYAKPYIGRTFIAFIFTNIASAGIYLCHGFLKMLLMMF